jgi:hypothetical protein
VLYSTIQKVEWSSLAVGKCQQEEPLLQIGCVQMLCIRIFNGTYPLLPTKIKGSECVFRNSMEEQTIYNY